MYPYAKFLTARRKKEDGGFQMALVSFPLPYSHNALHHIGKCGHIAQPNNQFVNVGRLVSAVFLTRGLRFIFSVPVPMIIQSHPSTSRPDSYTFFE